MSEMTSYESNERVIEGLAMAASGCREMAVLSGNHTWAEMAISLDGWRHNLTKLFHMKAMPRQDVLKMCEAILPEIKS